MQIDPLLLLAIILGAIGTLGTILTVISNTQQIWDRFRAKSRAQETQVRSLFESLLPSISTLNRKYDAQSVWNFLPPMKASQNAFLALDPTVKKAVPKIEKKLTELMDILGESFYFKYGKMVMGPPDIMSNQRLKPLVGELREDIEKWLSDH